MGYSVGELIVEIGGDVSDLQRDMNTATQSVRNFGNTIKSMGQSMTRFGRSWSLYVTAPIMAAGAMSIKFAMDIEKAEVAFGVFLGSAEKGKQIFKDLVQFSAETPLFLSSITASAQMLLATGTEADNLIHTLTVLGNASRADADIMKSLALNLGQVRAQGKLTGRELRDFGVRGIPLMQELAKNMGKTEGQIMSMVSAGSIGFAQVIRAFESMSEEGGRFHNLMDKVAKTAGGKFTTALDNVRIAGADLFKSFMPALTKLLNQIISIANFIRRLPRSIKNVAVIALGIIALMGPIIIGVGTILGIVGSLITSVGILATILPPIITAIITALPAIIPALGIVVGIITAIISSIVAVGVALVYLIGEGETFGEKLMNIFDRIMSGWNSLGDTMIEKVVTIINMMVFYIGEIMKVFNTAIGWVEGAWDTIVKGGKIMGESLVLLIVGYIQLMVQSALDGINLVIMGLNKIPKIDIEMMTGGDSMKMMKQITGDLSKSISSDTKSLLAGEDFVNAVAKAEAKNLKVDEWTTDMQTGVADFGQAIEDQFTNAFKQASETGDNITKIGEDIDKPDAIPKFAGAAEEGSVEAFKTIASSTKINTKIEKNTKEQVNLSRLILNKLENPPSIANNKLAMATIN